MDPSQKEIEAKVNRALRPRKSVSMVEPDKEEKFVLRTVAIYLLRLLDHHQPFDNQTWILLAWVLGSKLDEITSYLYSDLSGSIKDEYAEEILGSANDHEEFGRTIRRFLPRAKESVRPRFERHALTVLRQQIRDLRYQGRSKSEKIGASLARMFKLTKLEAEFSLFIYILTVCGEAEAYFVDHLHCQYPRKRKVLEIMFQANRYQVEDLFSGTLATLQFFEADHHNLKLEREFFDFFENPTERVLSSKLFRPVSGPVLPLDFHFIEQEKIEFIVGLLKSEPKTSTHLLLYGPPGTGKSSLAKGLAKEVGLPTYEVFQDKKNETRSLRTAITACLNLTTADHGATIIVDEADNLLNTRHSWFDRGETQDKGWLNKLLESPGVRMIWVTNRIDEIEESVRRRFAYSLQFKAFSHGQRNHLWDSILRRHKARRLLSQKDAAELARRFKVSAGAIDLAVKKGLTVTTDPSRFKEVVTLALEAHETLLCDGDRRLDKDGPEKGYTVAGLNLEGDVESLISCLETFDQRLRESAGQVDGPVHMNILFHGPSGTGKSELARFLAEHLGREIIVKRLSDLLNPYVGRTESLIAAAFEEAEDEEAVLVIDEADSLLFSRDRAIRSWEISQTNEFLTQMERFRGILICTTNRLGDLDGASIRRFNYKVGFDYLTPDGNLIFYQKLLSPLVEGELGLQGERKIRSLVDLAPGDFRTVKDQFSFMTGQGLDHDRLIAALGQEVKHKAQGRKRVTGFTGR